MKKVFQEAVVTLPQSTPDGVFKPIAHTNFRNSVLANLTGFTVTEGTQMRYDEEDTLIHDPVFVYTVLVEGAEDESLLRELATDCAAELDQDDFVFKTIYGDVLILEVPDEVHT